MGRKKKKMKNIGVDDIAQTISIITKIPLTKLMKEAIKIIC